MNTPPNLEKICQHHLFVCTSNTCRSPFAAVVMRNEVSRKLGIEVEDLEKNGFVIRSAGPWAYPGSRITREAQIVLDELGYPVPGRGSRELTADLATESAHIYAMTQWHKQKVLEIVPDAANRIRLVRSDGLDIEDPIGYPLPVYRDVGKIIQKSVQEIVKNLFKPNEIK